MIEYNIGSGFIQRRKFSYTTTELDNAGGNIQLFTDIDATLYTMNVLGIGLYNITDADMTFLVLDDNNNIPFYTSTGVQAGRSTFQAAITWDPTPAQAEFSQYLQFPLTFTFNKAAPGGSGVFSFLFYYDLIPIRLIVP